MMTSKTRRWAKGCGCGCGLLTILVGLLTVGGFPTRISQGLGAFADAIDRVGTYIQVRNEALLGRRMSAGEYVYIYTLVYYSWLGHRPAERLQALREPDRLQVGLFDEDSGVFAPRAVRRRYRRYLLGMVRAQLASVGSSLDVPERKAWRTELERELRNLEVDPGRVLWQDGLPPSIEVSLRPFRARLESTYCAATNPIELPLAKHEAPWGSG